MNKKILFYLLALFLFFVFMPDAFARDGYIEMYDGRTPTTVINMGVKLLYNVIGVVMVLGGFGLIGIGVGAVFGKVNWKWAAYLAFGLFVCAMLFGVIGYFTGGALSQFQLLYDTMGAPVATITASK